ncbi:hypothetical protein [Delftia acidovorans]|uniref:hypothetical protein n=1 Tax=Delftia acidovorans TaxID=80866 RepID=UPI00403A42C6
MQATFPAFRLNRNALFYMGLFALLAFFLLAPQHAFASEGTGGSLPYESWLTVDFHAKLTHHFHRILTHPDS